MNKKQLKAQEEFSARMQAAHDLAVQAAHPLFLAYAQVYAEYIAHREFCAAHSLSGPSDLADYRIAEARRDELREQAQSMYMQYQRQIEINWRENVSLLCQQSAA